MPHTGRPARFCGTACRSKAYRRRRAAHLAARDDQNQTRPPVETAPAADEPPAGPHQNVLLLGNALGEAADAYVRQLTDGDDPDRALNTLTRVTAVYYKRLIEQARHARREALGLPDPADLIREGLAESATAMHSPAPEVPAARDARTSVTRHETTTPDQPAATPTRRISSALVPVPASPRNRFGRPTATHSLADELGDGWTLAGWPDQPDVFYVLLHKLAVGWVERGIVGTGYWVAIGNPTASVYITDHRSQQPLLHHSPQTAARTLKAAFDQRRAQLAD
ncbi:hypothetical protein [Kitasatospora sp. NPDC004272]